MSSNKIKVDCTFIYEYRVRKRTRKEKIKRQNSDDSYRVAARINSVWKDRTNEPTTATTNWTKKNTHYETHLHNGEQVSSSVASEPTTVKESTAAVKTTTMPSEKTV